MSTMQAAMNTLVKARDIIKEPGHWTTGRERRFEGDQQFSYCAIGAVREAVGGFGENYDNYVFGTPYSHAICELDATLGLSLGPDITIVDFNDMQASAEPVIAVFDRTINRLAAELGNREAVAEAEAVVAEAEALVAVAQVVAEAEAKVLCEV